MYTEVNEQSDRFLLANQGKKIQGSQQKIFPPLPPIPPILVLPTNTSKQTRQIGRSTSLHCMLDDTRNHEYKIPSVSDEPHYDDVMIAKAQSINPNVSLSNGDEYQLMQKTDGTTDLEGMVNLLTSKYTEVHGELKKSQQSLTELQRVISDIKESISSIQLQIASFSSQSERGREKIDSEAATNFLESQKNRTRLSRMNTEEVKDDIIWCLAKSGFWGYNFITIKIGTVLTSREHVPSLCK